MTRYCLAILLVGCGRPTPNLGPVTATPVTLAFATAPVVGSKTTETADFHVDVTVGASMDGRGASVHKHGDGHYVLNEEVLEVTSGAISKLRVRYGDRQMTITSDDGDTKDQPDPRDGKVYDVALPAGGGEVTVAGAGSVSEDETKKIRKDFKWLGKPSTLFTGSRTFTPGQRVGDELLAHLTSEAERLAAPVAITRADLVFRGQHADEGVFDLDLEATSETSVACWLVLKGQLGLHVPDGRASEYAGSGKLTCQAPAGAADIKVEGQFEAHVVRTTQGP